MGGRDGVGGMYMSGNSSRDIYGWAGLCVQIARKP